MAKPVKGSWVSKELKKVYGAKRWKAGKGVDLNGNGILEKNEKIDTYKSNKIPGNNKAVIGDWADWLAFYRANSALILAKVGQNKSSIFHWAGKLKSTNPLHMITSIESPVVKHRDVLTAYKKAWGIIARARKIPIRGRTKVQRAKAKLLALRSAMVKSGIKLINTSEKHLFVENIVDGELDCDTSGFLILAEAHEKGWPLFGVHVPQHYFVRWVDPRSKKRFNFDAVYKERFPKDRTFKKLLNIPKQSVSAGVYLKNLKLSDTVANVFANRALTLQGRGRLKEAIRDYTTSLKLDSLYDIALCNRGVTYGELGQYADAIKDFTASIKLNSRDVVSYKNRGVIYVALKRYDDAIRDFKKSGQLNPKYAEGYYSLGILYDRMGRRSDAIAAFSKAVKANPKHVNSFAARGFLYDNMGKYAMAIKDYTRAIAIAPKDAEHYRNRGLTYGKMAKHGKAILDLKKALALNPKIANARDALEIAYYMRAVKRIKARNFAGAIRDLREVLKLNPKHSLAPHVIKKYTPCIKNPKRCP